MACSTFKKKEKIVAQTHGIPNRTQTNARLYAFPRNDFSVQRHRAMKRLSYIDWMRGLACVLMFQTHCYDSWLSPEARHSTLFVWSQLGGTLPAPLFLFLAGVSFALVTERLREKGGAPGEIAKTTIRRGAGNFRLRPALPRTGIRSRLPLGSVDRSLPRRYPQHSRPLDDPDGRPLLAKRGSQSGQRPRAATIRRSLANARNLRRPSRRDASNHFNAAPLDHASPLMAAMAARVLHQRRPRPRKAPALALSTFSLVGFRICWPGRGLLPFHKNRQAPRRSCFRSPGWDRHSRLPSFHSNQQLTVPALFRPGLLAHQPEFFPDALWRPPDYFILRLRLVPLGPRADGIQSHHSARQNLVARLLGAHRICLRSAIDTPQAPMQHPPSHSWFGRHLSSHARSFGVSHQLEGSPHESAKARCHACFDVTSQPENKAPAGN